MDYWYLICSFSWVIVAFAFYKIHKLWYKNVTENDKLYIWYIKVKSFGNWAGVIVCVIMSIVYFFRAID